MKQAIDTSLTEQLVTRKVLTMNIIKQKLKKTISSKMRLIPRRIQYRFFGVNDNFKNMPNNEVFNKIYKKGIWGKDAYGDPISGSGSHANEIIQPYISEVSKFLLEIKPSIVVDLGCGDFNVGKNFINMCEKYLASDVSSEILDRNKDKFSHLKNVDFSLLDLTSDYLPIGDVCFVRQVLQHLSNDHIKKFANKLNSQKPYKYLVLTEHLPLSEKFKPNVDKNTGADTRLSYNSGVVLHNEPFGLDALEAIDLLEINEGAGRIKTTIYKF